MIATPAQTDLARFKSKLAAMGEVERYWRINRFEAFYNGQQYVGRPSFWDDSVPLRERAPIIQANFTRAAIGRLATLVFGDRSFPRIVVGRRVLRDELSESERDALQALVDELVACASLSLRMRQTITEGLKCSSACVLTGLIAGKPVVEFIASKQCTPTFSRDGRVECLVVQYKHPNAERPKEWMWYRREITATVDRVYNAVPVEEDRVPDWSTTGYTDTPVEFCAVRWVRNMRPATAAHDDVDGVALIDGLEDEIEALDMELSQLYRNAMYNTDPQFVRVGSPASPPANGSQAQGSNDKFSWANSPLPRGFRDPGAGAVKKSPGRIWDVPAGGDAKVVESSGAGANIARGFIEEIRRVLCDATGVVLVDPKTMGTGEVSGRALTLMHASMLDVADNLRVEYGDVLVDVVNDLLRHLAGGAAAAHGVNLATWEAARPVLSRLYGVSVDGASRVWIGAALSLQWGPYFEPSAADRSTAVETAMKANGGRPVLSLRTTVATVAPLFGVQDVDAQVESIERELGASHDAVRSTLAGLSHDDDAPEVSITDDAAKVASETTPASAEPQAKAADSALNGAQVESMVSVVTAVAAGTLPRDAAKAIIQRAFLVGDAEAEAILGSAGKGFTVAPKESK